MISYSEVLENLTVLLLHKILPAYYITRRVIAILTTVR
jgi:hypothetical protein